MVLDLTPHTQPHGAFTIYCYESYNQTDLFCGGIHHQCDEEDLGFLEDELPEELTKTNP